MVRPVFILSAWPVCCVVGCAGPVYNVIDLGSLGGASSAFAVNASGEAAGVSRNAAGYNHAMLFNNGVFTDLTAGTGAMEGQASGINSAGQVAGTAFNASGQAMATVWSNGPRGLGTLGGSNSYATAINARGDVVGQAQTASGEGHAFLDAGGTMHDLGTFDGGWSSAYAVDSLDQVAGYGMTASGAFHAFLWSAAAGFEDLGTLGGRNSYAMGINDSGQVVGNSMLANGISHAFLYTGSQLLDLGSPGGASYAYSINNSGEIAGYYTLANGASRAFLDANGVMLDLNSLLSPGSGWVLMEAYGINDSGEIAGAGWYQGQLHAFLAVDPPESVPEPGTPGLLAVGFGAALLSRQRLKQMIPVRRRHSRMPAYIVAPRDLPAIAAEILRNVAAVSETEHDVVVLGGMRQAKRVAGFMQTG